MNYIKTILSTVFVLSTFFTAFAQDIKLTTQAEVDAFDKSITAVNGRITIEGSSITNLDALSNLTNITVLYIKNTRLVNLDGLSQVRTINMLGVQDNSYLTNIDGLSKVTSALRSLAINNNPSLTNLDGLSGITSYDGVLSISDNDSLTNLDGLSQVTTVGGGLHINSNRTLYDCCGIQTLLSKTGVIKGEVDISGNASTCDSKSNVLSTNCSIEEIALTTQAEVDAFDQRMTFYKGSIRISGYNSPDPIVNLKGLSNLRAIHRMGILNISATNLKGLSNLRAIHRMGILNISATNLDGLSNLTTIGKSIMIDGNPNLTNVNGLSNLKTVKNDIYISDNGKLGDCCAVQHVLSTVPGLVFVEGNAAGCNSQSELLSSCNPSDPDEGEEVPVQDYKKNLWELTRWELQDCGTNQTYKFAQNGTVKNTGKAFGTYAVNDKTLTLTPTGGTPKRYTISNMTTNVMHLIDASGKETIYGRRQHIEDKIASTNWREKGGVHDQMRMKFKDASNMELITIGNKGSKMAATYTLSNENKTLTITFSDPAKAKEQGFPTTLKLNVKTFNYMMMKLDGGDGVICFMRA